MNSYSKTILITGCTSGIGRETSLYLNAKGYKLVLVGRNIERLNKLSVTVDAEHICVCDLSDSDSIPNIFEDLYDNGIKLDGFVHCAGISVISPIRLLKEADVLNIMNVNFLSFIIMCKYFSQKSISHDGASIVALSSMATITRYKGALSYVASKNALEGAVTVASKEFLKRGIRVNAILPAYVKTEMTEDIDEITNYKKSQPLGLIEPIQIAYLIEFLLSDKAKYITGAFIPMSAGM